MGGGEVTTTANKFAFLGAKGEMALRIAQHDWSLSLGPIGWWPASLKTAVGLVVHSPMPLVLLWGEDGVMIYNDAYSVFAGGRHPALLGSRVREGWPEVAAFTERVMEVGLAGDGLVYEKQELTLLCSGESEQVWLTLGYSPVFDESGRPGGVIAIVVDTTDRVRRDALAQLSERLRDLDHATDIAGAAAEILGETLGVSRVGYGTIDADTDTLHVERDWTAPDVETLAGVTHLREYGSFIDSLKRNEFIAIADVRQDERTDGAAAALEGRSARSFVNVPVVEQGRLVAVLFVNDAGVRNWSAEDLALIREVAERTRTAVERARSQAALRESEARFRFLDALARETAGSLDADAILATTTRMVGEYLGIAVCAYADMDEDEDGFTIRGDWSAPGSPSIVGHYSLADFGRMAVANLGAGLPLIVNDNLAELAPEEAATFQNIGIAATICMPLVKEGRLTALMAIHDKVPRVWSAGELALIREVTERSWAHVERVGAEAELRGSEDNFRTLARAMPNHVWTSPPDGLLDWFNEQVYAYTGVEPGSLDGTGWASIVHPDDVVAAAAHWAKALQIGETYEAEFRLRRADGAWRWHIARAVPIKGEFGQIVRWIGTNTDIQDQKEVAGALADINATLERRVEERTSQLVQTEEALRQAQKMEAVGQLTGGIAHDFNNLLAGISGSLELLEKRLAAGQLVGIERYIDAAQGSARRAAALTQRLLAFSRRQTLDPKSVNADRLIAGMEELIRRSVGPNIELEVIGSDDLWTTRVDPSQLENALLNLCINARDAMSPGGGKLTIRTANEQLDAQAAKACELPPGRYVLVCVTDTGTGMRPEVKERAFDPFYTTKPLGQGTGLGLSMIYGFVRQSGGQVRIDTEVGRGTTICLYLPHHSGPAEAEETAQPDKADPGHGETVLVIDDEEVVRMLIVDVLAENGYAVLEASDGLGALEILQSAARIDLLITDVGLPGGMNGRQVADAARVARPDLKVLFITGYAEHAVIGSGHLDRGMEVITKPFSTAVLANKIHDLING